MIAGLIPTAQTLVEPGGIRVTANQDAFSNTALTAPNLRHLQRRREACRAIRSGFRVWLPNSESRLQR